jgi:hypothetical protein
MKKIIIVILLGIFTFPNLLQAQVLDQKKSLYQKKVISFTKMKRTGVGLTIGGALLTVGGIAMMVSSDYNAYDSNMYDYSATSDDGAGEWILGYVTTCVGVGATTGGIVLWSMGGSRVRSYQKKLNSLSLNLNPGQYQMFSLAYRF